MTTPARLAESDRAGVIFHAAIVVIAAQTVAEALRLWQGVVPTRIPTTRAAWIIRAVQMILRRRTQSRELAFTYYRLTRALETGFTIPDPALPDAETVTLPELRTAFTRAANPRRPGTATVTIEGAPDPIQGPEAPIQEVPDLIDPADLAAEAEEILIEQLEAEAEALALREARAEEEALLVLDSLGPDNLANKVGALDPNGPASEVDQQREDAHASAGARAAAAAARLAQNGARSELWSNVERDKRAIGYVRVSRTGTPCGFCAMLISRGFVPKSTGFKTEQSATFKSPDAATYFQDGDLYHDNCNCYAVPMFVSERYKASPRFALNRKYGEEWPRVTNGLSGKDALSAWRKHIRAQRKAAEQAVLSEAA